MFKKLLVVLTTCITLVAGNVWAAADQDKIDDIVAMLKNNPQLVDDLHQSLQLYLQQKQKFSQLLEASQDYINDPRHATMGAEKAELTLVNMTDYSCPYCKKLDGELEKLVKAYPQIKVVNLYLPLKEHGQEVNSASYALNVWQHDKKDYAKVHDLLVKKPGAHNAKSLEKIAEVTGTEEYLKADKEVQGLISNNYSLFTNLGLRGTPALIIGEEVIPGYVPFEQLEQVVKAQL